jgi:hypothetical protein
MDEKEIRARLDELDADLTGAHAIAVGSHWPSTALACAMLDAGLIEKSALLKIVDTLMAIASAFAVTEETDPTYSAHSLEVFRLQLEQMELKPGSVLKDLEQIEIGATEEASRYHEMQKKNRKKGPDEGKDS